MFRKNSRFVSLMVICALLFQIVGYPLTASAQSITDSNEIKGQPVEVIEKRTETSKTFANVDGTYTGYLYSGPIHFLAEGKWQEFDNRIKPAGNGEFENTANPFKTRFGSSGKSPALASFANKEFKIEYALTDLPQLGDKYFSAANDVVPQVEENTITYAEIFPKVDLRQIVFDHGVKEDFILKEYTGQNSFVFSLKTAGVDAVKEEDGSISFYKQGSKDKVFTIPKPYMVDSNIDDHLGEGAVSNDVNADIVQVGANFYITITADDNWLRSPDRVFPIYIDPTTNLNDNADAFVSTAAPNTNFSAKWNNTYYTLNTGYYDSTSGTTYTYIKFDTSPVSGKLITSASMNIYCAHSYYVSVPTGVWLNTVNAPWSETGITWNNKPSTTALTSTNAVRNTWASFDVTTTLAKWAKGSSTNYGFMLHTNGYGQTYWKRFYARENTTNKPYISVTYSDPPAAPTGTAYGNGPNSSNGYVNLSWNTVPGATGYNVAIWNGVSYERKNVGNVTSWTTHGKGLWPTPAEIATGRYQLHINDSNGADLPDDPRPTYITSGGSYGSSTTYWFRVTAYNSFSETYTSDAYGAILPERTRPNQPGAVSVGVVDGPINSGSSAKITATWNGVTDLPSGIASGVKQYKVQLIKNGATAQEVNVSHTGTGTHSYTFSNQQDTSSYSVKVAAYDNNGNFSAFTASSTVSSKDRTPPAQPTSVSITPSSWTANVNPVISWNGITDNVGVQNVQYRIDSGSWLNTGINNGTGTTSVSASALSEGTHTIYIRGIDAQGNYGSSRSLTYYKDTNLPSVSITSPSAQQTINGLVPITGTIQDANIKSWKLEYGLGTSPSSYLSLASGTGNASSQTLYTWNVSDLLEEATYTLRLTAEDMAANKRQTAVQVVKSVSTVSVSPGLQIDYPQNNSVITDQINSVLYQRTNNGGSEGLRAKLYINNRLVTEEAAVGAGFAFDAAQYPEGSENSLYVKATDQLGNELYSATTYNSVPIADTFIDTTKVENLNYTQRTAANSIALAKNGTSYYTSGSLQATAVTLAGTLNTIKISATETKPTGTGITYQVSADGGVTWQNAAANTPVELNHPGNVLKLKATLTTANASVTPEIDSWQVQAIAATPNLVFTAKLLGEPKNLSAKPNVNYTTLLRWEASATPGVTYNIYRSAESGFNPGPENLIAEGITDTYWNDFNLNYGQLFYYKVTSQGLFNNQVRESLPSNQAWAQIVAADELNKRLGLQEFWGFSSFRTGSGNGYINLSSGNLHYQSVDFIYPGPLFAMVMRKGYNSQATTKTPLGYGWDFSFNTNLLKEYDASGNEIGLILKDGDGSLHRFGTNPDGTYQSPPGVHLSLRYDSETRSYEIKRKDNVRYLFDKNLRLKWFIEPNGNYLELIYNSVKGNLVAVRNRTGDTATLDYDDQDRLIQITDPAGRQYHYVYEQSYDKLIKTYTIIEGSVEYAENYIYGQDFELLSGIKDPKDQTTLIEYTSSKASKITDTVGDYFDLNYGPGITSLTDNHSKTVSFEYNQNGNVTKKTDPLNQSVNYEYDPNFNVTRLYYVNSINGADKTINYYYSYDLNGNLKTIKDPFNNITEYNNYNSFNKVGQVKAPVSPGVYAVTTYTYDASGNLLTATDPENRLTSYTYDSFGNRTSATDNFGNVTAYAYDTKGRLSKISEPLGKVTEILAYDTQGNPIKTKDALGNITQYQYDLLGRQTKIIYPDNNIQETSYDLNHNVVQTKNRRGFSTSYAYDALDRLVAASYADGAIFSADYGFGPDNNQIVTYTDGENRSIRNYYDAAGRLIKEEQNGTSMTYAYDKIGNMIKATDAEGREVTAAYNELNRQTAVTRDPLGVNARVEYTYDLLGNTLTSKDGEQNITSYQYDKLGRLKKATNSVAGQTIDTLYQYDLVEGQLVKNKVVDPLSREKITYFDALGRVVKEVDEGTPGDSERLITQYEYDLNGNLKKTTGNDNNVINYAYNNLNQLTRLDYDASSYTAFTYDANGNRKTMTDVKEGQSISTSYAYDNIDRLVQMVQDGQSIDYQYDHSDNIVKVSYPTEPGQRDVEYIYDSTNQLDKILVNTKTIREYFYKPSGQIDYLKDYLQFDTAGPGYIKTQITFDTAGLPTKITYLDNGSAKKEEYSMTYDKRGYITAETAYTNYSTPKSVTRSFTYDGIGRLTSVVQDSKTTSYAYDKVGNRLTLSNGTDNYSYTYNQFNSLTQIEKNGLLQSTFQYDLRGNQTKEVSKTDFGGVIKDVTTDYTYDSADRLTAVSISMPGETARTSRNYYNGDGQRVKQIADGFTTKYFYDRGQLLYTTDENNRKAQEHILDPGGAIVASKRFDGAFSNMFFFYNYDVRGSVTSIINPDGGRVKGYEYDEFGNTQEVGEPLFKNDIKFSGAVHDQSTGLYYMNARFYNPSTGRFLTQDSYGGSPYEPWTQHLYSYSGNNPVNMIDPTGHFPIFAAMAIGAFVGAVVSVGITFAADIIDGGGIDTSWQEYVGSAVNGAILGATAPVAAGASIAAGIASMGFAGVSASAVSQTITTGKVNPVKAVKDGVISAATFGAARAVGTAVSKAVSKRSIITAKASSNRSTEISETGSINVYLKYKSGWTEAQRAEADLKVQILTNARTVKTTPVRGGTSGALRYVKANGSKPNGVDIDHKIDLQLSGPDDLSNLWPLNRSANRSLGSQIWNQIKHLPDGTSIDKFFIR